MQPIFNIILFLLIANPLNLYADHSQIITLDNGDEIAWDGEYYDFRDADGYQMIKLWIPPNIETVRGIFISGHGGGTGDSRNFARDENMRDFATRLGFGVAGMHNFPGSRIYSQGAEVFFNALDEFANLGHHPELRNVPFATYGSSNGGSTSYGFVNYAPERALCFLSNVASRSNPEIPVDEALKVPGVFVIGKFDALTGESGYNAQKKMFEYALPKGALWSWAIELKGHEDGYAFDVYVKMVEQVVKARYPDFADPKKGPVQLKTLSREDGWLADHESWGDGLTYVAPYNEYSKEKSEAGWVLNKDLAFVYRGMATYHNPVSVSVKEFDRTLNTNTDPGTMYSIGGPVVKPGATIHLQCDVDDFPEWNEITFYNGSEKLGSVSAGNQPQIAHVVDGESLVYAIVALVKGKDGTTRTSSPMHFFVRDPQMDWKVENQPDVFTTPKTSGGTQNFGKEIRYTGKDENDGVLVAYGLPAELEKQYSARDGKISEFWHLIDEDHDQIHLSQRTHAREGAEFNFVLTHDCNMVVKSAYGADGLYLLFEVNDDNDVSWPREFTATENEQFYHNFDAVDFMLDGRSIDLIFAPENKKLLASPHFAFSRTTIQYQSAMGAPKNKTEGIKLSQPDPWDMHSVYWTLENLKKYRGIEIENVKTDHFYKAQEWFIPWEQVHDELNGEPDALTRFAFSVGFNDRDKGEHMPPGVSPSGGLTKASNSLRWINRSDPWGASPRRGNKPFNWGEIELGPVLENEK